MVRHALITILLALVASSAHAQALDLRLPDCAPTHLDGALLRELLFIELGDRSWRLTIGSSLCDSASTSLDIEVLDPSAGGRATEIVPLAIDDDPRAAARAAALAIAERVPRMTLIAPPPPALAVIDRASVLGAPTPPSAWPPIPDEPVETPRGLPATFGVGLVGRIAPVLPSWALGLRVELGANLDPTWSIRGELVSTWTRATANEGDVDAVVLAGAVAIGASVFRDDVFDLVLAGRAEAGALVAMGWTAATSTGAPTLHPWVTAGAELDGIAWLTRDVALVVDLGLSAIVYGTRLSTWPSGTQIDLSYFLIDLGVGVRVPL